MTGASPRVSKQHLVDALKSAWWVIPVSIALCVGLLFVQDSRFQSEPARVETTRRFEGLETLSTLAALDIDAQAFAPILSIGGEIARFNSPAVGKERNEKNGFDVLLTIGQTPGDYNVINREITERNTVYSIIAVGSGIFSVTCSEASEKDCARALDVGVAEFESRRNEAIQSSISAVASKLTLRLEAIKGLISTSTESAALSAQYLLEAQLASQIAVLDSVKQDPAFQLRFIDETVSAKSATVSSVAASTYLLGAVIGSIISLLVILQFAVLRSRRS